MHVCSIMTVLSITHNTDSLAIYGATFGQESESAVVYITFSGSEFRVPDCYISTYYRDYCNCLNVQHCK